MNNIKVNEIYVSCIIGENSVICMPNICQVKCGDWPERYENYMYWCNQCNKLCPYHFTGEKIPLRKPCDALNDICKNENAECKTGLCLCEDEFYESGNTCSE